MKAKDLLAALSAIDPEAEVLIWKQLADGDDEIDCMCGFKVNHATAAFTDDHQIAYQDCDIDIFSNPGEGSVPVFVVGNEPIEKRYRVSHEQVEPGSWVSQSVKADS